MDTEAIKLLSAGICMGVGTIGPGIGEGMIAAKALEGIARNPKMADKLFSNMLIAMAITESLGIYALVISLILIFAA